MHLFKTAGYWLVILNCAAALRRTQRWTTISEAADLLFDEEERLFHNMLAYSGDSCLDHTYGLDLSHRHAFHADGNLASAIFQADNKKNQSSSSNNICALTCLNMGTHISHIPHPLPHHSKTFDADNTPVDSNEITSWYHEKCQKLEIGFLLYGDRDATIYWVSEEGERVDLGALGRGEKNTQWRGTFVGHAFEIVEEETERVLGSYTALFDAIHPIGEPKSRVTLRDEGAVVEKIKDTLTREWDRAHRVTRTFTELGFNKGKLPLDLWSSMSAYYYNNRNNKVLEEWDNKGVFVNWWETDCYMVPMPWVLKTYWQSRLKDLVEAWGGVPIELTDIYGMRRYEEGARLITHVDREETHAVSLIINIAQEKMRSPWAVEIYDHADRLHEVTMEPGDIVYYESARCLHGRMRPLDGAFYVNLFAHYRPTGDPQWFLKSNPSTAVDPLLDIGECTPAATDGAAPKCVRSSRHAHPFGVEAMLQNEETGELNLPFLSPSLEKLTTKHDLFQYWKKVSPSTPFKKSARSDDSDSDENASASSCSSEEGGCSDYNNDEL